MSLPRLSKALRHLRFLSLLLVAPLAWVGCGGEPSPSTPADASYRVQGVIQRIAGEQHGYREIVVRHQSVVDFRNREGEVVGMESMAMPFAVVATLDLDDLAPQDPVVMTFEVRWDGEPVLLVTALEKLPAGAEVDFSTPNKTQDPAVLTELDAANTNRPTETGESSPQEDETQVGNPPDDEGAI